MKLLPVEAGRVGGGDEVGTREGRREGREERKMAGVGNGTMDHVRQVANPFQHLPDPGPVH